MNAGRLGRPISQSIAYDDASYVFYQGNAQEHKAYHFHGGVEIVYCLAGSGTIFVGNYVSTLSAGDLFLIGTDLPHAILGNEANGSADNLQLLILQFKEEILASKFFAAREFSHIDELLKRGLRGLKFKSGQDKVQSMLQEMRSAAGILAISQIISIADILGKNLSYEFLNSIHFANDAVIHHDTDKINKIFAFTEQHYAETISLAQVSALINFTETSFCRYFKMQTGKSYFQYLTEIRIAHACLILIEDDRKDMEEVCFACGFNNPSNFYKQFKKIVKLTPKEYQARGRKKLLYNTPMVA